MLKDPKLRRIALIAAGAVVLVAVLAAVFLQDAMFRMSIRPPGRFADEQAAPRPDYAKPESWALRPALPPPGGWETPWGVDTFFVAPTAAWSGARWNASPADAETSKLLTASILPNHAGPFLKAGPVYAPLYRQASLYSEIEVGGEGDGAFALAYDDVLRAFDHYIATDNRFRGIVLAGVGQGGLHIQRLLSERFQEEPLKSRLAAAYIIDAALPADLPGKAIAQPVCASHDQIHCLIGWTSNIAGGDASRLRNASPVWNADWEIARSGGRPLVCVNPMRWVADGELSARSDHRGAARARDAIDLDPAILANAVSARCNDGILEVEHPTAPELQPEGGAGAQYRTAPFNLFYADLVPNVVTRMKTLTAFLDDPQNNVRKPAEPLPPSMILDSPIYRPNGQPEPVR